jgi:glycyl-tRNA synthetase
MADASATAKMEKIVALCKRRGFIFQSSEIYGGLNGAWDYGPLGVELKRNLKDYWWRCMTQWRDDIVGFDGSILMNRAVWQASGHEATFSDPMVACKHCRKLLRADQVWSAIEQSDWYDALAEMFALGELDTTNLKKWAETKGRRDAPNLALIRNFQVTLSWLSERLEADGGLSKLSVKEFVQYLATEQFKQTGLVTPCPHCGGELSEPRAFNLMFKTYVGATQDESSITYLRPETAQAMFVQFKNVLEVARKKLPFGIAQIGKAFRNEINPRNFTFRSREFEQMEVEFFVKPGTGPEWLEKWKEDRLAWYEAIGIPRSKIHVLTVPDADRAFYSQGTYDLEYEFPFGVQELEGIAHRGNYDLSQHAKASGKPLEYFDEEAKQKYLPEVVEPSAGVDRTVLALLCEAFAEETVKDEESGKEETRTVLRFAPRMAPVKAGIFPLLKNKPELVAKAKAVQDVLRPLMKVSYDEAGSIGKRYRRIDEEGTPFGITVDFETLEGAKEASSSTTGAPIAAGQKDTVTLRHRDSMKQERIAIADLPAYLLIATT